MSKPITVKQVRDYIELGVVVRAYIMCDLSPGQWMICIEGSRGESWTLQTARGEVRSFSSMDAAVNALVECGVRVTSLSVEVA